MGTRRVSAFVVSFAATIVAVGVIAAVGVFSPSASSARSTASGTQARAWTAQNLTGAVQLKGEVPLAVAHGGAKYLAPLPANFEVKLNFGLPINDMAALNRLIVQEANSHRYIGRAQLYNRFSPPQAQLQALASWLKSQGFKVTHVPLDRLSLGVEAPAGLVERTLHIKLNEYLSKSYTTLGVKVQPYAFYSNTTSPTVPARFGLQTISGLSSVDRFFTDVQLAQAATQGKAVKTVKAVAAAKSIGSPIQAGWCSDGNPISPVCSNVASVRSGGYFPSDIRSLYDVAPHTNASGQQYNGQGETLGFTLWGAGETQAAMNTFANDTGDQPITVDKSCVATGSSNTPSSCSTVAVAPDHLLTILENGNLNNSWGGADETGLDIEQAHGIATHAALKYYDGDCEASVPVGSGLTNGNSCNGSDTGLEDAIEDAANDPTLHTISNSWGYGGDPEWGLQDPFTIATQNSFAIAAAAGTTFYFSTGDDGTYESGYPADSPYVVSVGGTTLFSTSNPAQLSTEDTWAAGGAWCSNIFPRPAWQNGPGVTANADCSGRAIPDVSAVADTNSAVFEAYSRPASTTLAAAVSAGATNIKVNSTTSMNVGGTLLIDTGANQEVDTIASVGTPATNTTLTAATAIGATNIKVAADSSILAGDIININTGASNFDNDVVKSVGTPTVNTTLTAAANAGATNIKTATVTNISAGDTITISLGATNQDTTTVTAVGTVATGLTVSPALTFAHANAAPVQDLGTGLTLTGGLSHSHASGEPVFDTGTGVNLNTALASSHSNGTPVYTEVAGTGSVGGTSVAGPEWNGLTAVLENFVGQQSYPGTTPTIGFTGPIIYKLGNLNQNAYFRDVLCGNDADPSGSPDGESAQPGWDAATGWGAPDWYHFATGYAQMLGATGLTTPSSLSQNYSWTCAKTPTNSSERGVSFPSSSEGFSVGATGTSWYSEWLASGSWGSINDIYETTNGGSTWVPSNSDMTSISCTSASTCIEVGDGGGVKATSNSGATWTSEPDQFNKGLTQVTCPSASVCYAAGDRGFVLKSTNGGQTWTELSSTDGNPIYGLYCASTQICYATDIYAHIIATTNGGASWTWQTTPVTTPGVDVPGSGGPNPFAGLFGISCVDSAGQDCVAVGGYPPTGTTPPIVSTTNGGSTWTSDTSNIVGSGNYLAAVTCLPNTTTCYAVGRNGTIVTTTNMTSWTTMTSNTTNMLNDVTCSSTTSCVAVGQNGTVDVLTGTSWAPTTGIENSLFLAGVTCPASNYCYVAGKEGLTMAIAIISPTSIGWDPLAGGGIAAQMNSISCPNTSTCFAVGNAVSGAGSIETTTDAGQIWSPQLATGTGQNLNGVSCNSTTNCVAVGNLGITEYTTNGTNWTPVNIPGQPNLDAVSCAGPDCTAVGANGIIINTTNSGLSWTTQTSGTTATLNAVTCPTASTCFAAGSVVSGSAVIDSTTNDGASWSLQTSNSPQALSGITCRDAFNCFAGGAGGTVVTTNNGGATWTQQGNPLSGPTSALNASVSSLDAINAVGCSSSECAMGTGSSGDIMVSPLLTVTVNATQTAAYQINNLTNLPASSAYITYSPASEAPNVTGTLTCSTTATPTSPVGSYPVSNCSGLSASGYSVVYNYAASSYTVAFPTANTNPTGQVPSTLSVSIANVAPSFGAFTAGVTQTYSATTSATITSSAASATFQAADPSSTFPGHLVNSAASGGPYELPQGLQVAANDPSNTTGSGVFSNLANTNPATLLTYSAPVASDPVTITFQQPIAATDPLRTGTYTKTITFTLSTSTP